MSTPHASALAELLSSDTFSRAETTKALDGDDWHARRKLLAAVRAESQERFERAVQGLLETLDWPELAKQDVMIARVPVLDLLSPFSMRSHGAFESGCDHLAFADLIRLAHLAEKPDASFAWLAFRAVELGDEKALAAARARIRPDIAPRDLYSMESDDEGCVRVASIVSGRLGATAEEQLRAIAVLWGHGGLPSALALAVARERGLDVPVRVAAYPAPALRVVFDVAERISKDLAEETLVAAAGEKYMFDSRASAFALAWDEAHEVNANQQRFLACRLGRTLWSAYTPLEAGGLPVQSKGIRIAAKRLPDEAKAKKELEKKLEEQAKKLGGTPAPFGPARAVKDKAAALFGVVATDVWYADRAIELLAAGAPPDAWTDADGWTALHRAARGDHETVARLLAAGADPKKKTKAGLTALDLLSTSTGSDHVRSARALAAAGGVCLERYAKDAAAMGLAETAAVLVKASGASPAAAIAAAKEKRNARTSKALAAL